MAQRQRRARRPAAVRKKTISAPFSGVLGIRKIDVGEYLDSGSEIVSLQMLSPIYLDFATPERWISLVSVGQDIDAEVQAYAGEVFRGKSNCSESWCRSSYPVYALASNYRKFRQATTARHVRRNSRNRANARRRGDYI